LLLTLQLMLLQSARARILRTPRRDNEQCPANDRP